MPNSFKRFAQAEDHAVSGGFGAALRAAHVHRFAGNEAREVSAVNVFELVENPQHVLGVGHHIGRRDIGQRSNILGNLAHPAAANLFLLAGAEVMGIANHAALGAAQRNVDHGALPGHPHRQGADGVDGLLRVEADAALTGAAGIVVLHAEAAEDAHAAVIHVYRDGEVEFAQRVTQQFTRGRVKAQLFGYFIELRLGNLKGIKGFLLSFSAIGLAGIFSGRNCFTHCSLRHKKLLLSYLYATAYVLLNQVRLPVITRTWERDP